MVHRPPIASAPAWCAALLVALLLDACAHVGHDITFGYAETAVVPRPNYDHPASLPGYPEKLGDALHDPRSGRLRRPARDRQLLLSRLPLAIRHLGGGEAQLRGRGIHPSSAGQALLARAVQRAIGM